METIGVDARREFAGAAARADERQVSSVHVELELEGLLDREELALEFGEEGGGAVEGAVAAAQLEGGGELVEVVEVHAAGAALEAVGGLAELVGAGVGDGFGEAGDGGRRLAEEEGGDLEGDLAAEEVAELGEAGLGVGRELGGGGDEAGVELVAGVET